MKIIVTGSSGLIGSEAVRYFGKLGHEIIGVDSNLRKEFFGEQGEGWVRGIVKRGNNGGENSVRFQGVVVTCWVSIDGELFSLDLRKEKYLTDERQKLKA